MTTAIVLADSGPEIGLGHLRRCLVLARALADAGIEPRVLTPDPEGRRFALAAGFTTAPWPSDLARLPSADILVADSYRIDAALCRAWRNAFDLRVLIDDLADRALEADVVVNPNVYGQDLNYSAFGPGQVLAGLKYSLVDPAFAELRDQARPAPGRVLVAFGGTDDGTLGTALAESLLPLVDAPIDLVVSPLRKPAPAAVALARHHRERLTLHHGPQMLDVMGRAVLYAGACGSTVWEASAAGLGLVVGEVAGNQSLVRATLSARGIEAFDCFDAERMAGAVTGWLAAPKPNPLSSEIDGQGAERVAEAIIRQLPRRAAAS